MTEYFTQAVHLGFSQPLLCDGGAGSRSGEGLAIQGNPLYAEVLGLRVKRQEVKLNYEAVSPVSVNPL